MKQRIVSVLILLCMLVSFLPVAAFASEPAESQPSIVTDMGDSGASAHSASAALWEYESYGAGVALTKYLGAEVDVLVPSKIEVDGVDTPVLKLGESLFEDNDTINSVTLGKGVLEIGARAFYDCDSLVCILISEELTTIGDEAFYSCASFNSVIIYDTVTTIGTDAFAQCPNLTVWCNENTAAHTYVLAQGIPYEILNPAASPEIITIDGVGYYIMNAQAYAVSFDQSATEVTIPATVNGYPITELRETFKDCSNLKKVTLPEGLKVIGKNAFYYCYYLESVNIPSTVTKIDDHAFYNCYYNLTEITLPEGLEYIGQYAFGHCYNLTEITLPEGLEYIGQWAFYYCDKLQSIYIPGSVTGIGSYAFWYCSALTDVVIGEGVTYISSQAFYDCRSLKNISLPSTLTTIEYSAFYNCISLESISLPNGLKDIYDSAFNNCNKLRVIVIPDSVTYLSSTAFPASSILAVYQDSYAHNYAVNNSLLYAIYDGVNLPEVIDLDGVTYFVNQGEAIAIGFDKSSTEVVIPATVNGYPVTELRETFKECSNLEKVTLPEGLKVIGKNAFYYCYYLESVNIPSTVTKIDDHAFYNCYYNLTEITLPEGLEYIGQYAFGHCYNLTEITLPEGLEYIGQWAFYYCDKLQSIYIPGSVTGIGSYAFWYCSALTDVVIGEGVTYISSQAFYDCRSLKNISLPSTLTTIEYSAFYNCISLESISLPNGLKDIYDSAFNNCNKLRVIVIPESVTYLYSNAFPASSILVVHKDSYAHNFAVSNDLLYFILRRTENPEISYGASISGTVTTTEGYAVAGATVSIYYSDGVLKETVRTDADGRYTITYAEVGSYTIVAKNDNGSTATTRVAVKRMNVFSVYVAGDSNLTLKVSYSISGTINIIPAEITLSDTKGSVISSVPANSDGTFTFDNVPNGHYIVSGKTLGGYASADVTVFNQNVTGVRLHVVEAGVNLVGSTEIVGRDGSRYVKSWVDVTLYDISGKFVATPTTDIEGTYTFTNLPVGDYFIVAKTTEMRPDKQYGYNRSYELTGYGKVSAPADGRYEIDLISLYESKSGNAQISGKVTAKGDTQRCEVILEDIFGNEIARFNTGSNGKYKFSGISDGLYIVTAYTPSRGMGYTIVLVLDGDVYGETNMKIEKTDKVRDAEAAFFADVPDLETKAEAEEYRERIAEEKRFYDGLSKQEKGQLSEDYVAKLSKCVELLAGYDSTDSGVALGGLVISGDELERGDEISFNLGIEKQEKWVDNENGVETEQDYIHNEMKDKSSGEIVEYYEITMTKVTNGVEKQITSVEKDTDSMGKFRITLDIPEEYRGYAKYTLVHVHFGEVVVLTDLDDDPNTITVEVDRFSTFALAYSEESNIDESVIADDCIHEWFAVCVTDPTCSEDGYTVYTCVECEYSYTDTLVPALGHTEQIIPGYASTSESNGLTDGSKCSSCGEILVHQEIIPVHVHSYNAVVMDPTCTEDGYTTYTCTVCNDSYTSDYTDAIGHVDENNDHYCDICEVQVSSHNYVHVGTIPGTCTKIAYDVIKCSICGDEIHLPIADSYAPHTPGAADCTNDQVCTVCNAVLVPALGHTPGAEADCTNAQTCTVCNVVLAPAKGHDYTATTVNPDCENGGYTTYTCTVCNDSYTSDYTEALGHMWLEATYTAPKTCAACGATEGEPLPKNLIDLSMVSWSIENGGRVAFSSEITASIIPHLPEGAVVVSYTYEMGGDFHDSIYTPGYWKVYATIGVDTDGGYNEDAYELSETELVVEFEVYDADAAEPEIDKDHSKCESNWFERIITAILNFFRQLFGLPKQCVCGDKIK